MLFSGTQSESTKSTSDRIEPITRFNVVGGPAKHGDVDETQIGNDIGARPTEKTCE